MIVTRYVFTYKIADDKYLLINSLSGAVDLVDRRVVEAFSAIRRGATPALPADTVEVLAQRGYLYPSASDEEDVVSRAVSLNEQFRAKDQALCFVLCPTVSCNLRCPYCFEPHALHTKREVMTALQVEKAFLALDTIREQRPDIPNASINLFGGEPLQRFTQEPVAQILEAAARRDIPVSVTSNGTNVHHFIETLRPHRERLMFDISIDGIQEVHDQRRFLADRGPTFSRIVHNVDLLLGEGFRVAVRMNVNESNIDSVPAFLAYVRDQGWSHRDGFQLNISPVTNYTGNAKDGLLAPSVVEQRLRKRIPKDLLAEVPVTLNGDISRLTLPLSDIVGATMTPGEFMPSIYYCEASGALFYCMGPDGYIYPCNQILGSSEWAIGTYDPELSIDPAKAAMWHGRKVTNMPKCRECSIAFMCAGGCPVMAKRTTGSPTDSYCGTSKSELADYIRAAAPDILEKASALGG
jgi:uncharacterized protein